MPRDLILVAFITGNSSLEPLIEGLYAQLSLSVACSEHQGQKVILHLGWSM